MRKKYKQYNLHILFARYKTLQQLLPRLLPLLPITIIYKRFASDVQPSALFIELEDAATAAAVAVAGGDARPSSPGGDERYRSVAVGGFWFGLDTRHGEDAPGLAVIKRYPGGLEPSKRRPLRAQLQV